MRIYKLISRLLVVLLSCVILLNQLGALPVIAMEDSGSEALHARKDLDGENAEDTHFSDTLPDTVCEIIEFDRLPEEVQFQTVPAGTVQEELDLPNTLNVTIQIYENNILIETQTATPAAVTWTALDDYDEFTEGEYRFLPSVTGGVNTAEGVVLPVITITVMGSASIIRNILDSQDITIDIGTVFESGSGYEYNDHVVTLTDNAKRYTITGMTNTTRIRVKEGLGTVNEPVQVILDNVDIDVRGAEERCAFEMTAAAVNMTLLGNNSLKSGRAFAGLTVRQGGNLVIQSGDETGAMVAVGGDFGAGIGGSWGFANGSVTILSGRISAVGGKYSAGIGGGYYSDGGTVIIKGGEVTVTGSDGGAGIGGGLSVWGYGGNGANVFISGQETIVIASGSSSDIGSGGSGNGGSLSVSDGATLVLEEKGTDAQTTFSDCKVSGAGAGGYAGKYSDLDLADGYEQKYYDGNFYEALVTSNQGGGITYLYTGQGGTSYPETGAGPVLPGTYIVTATAAGKGEYRETKKSFSFEIIKAVPVIDFAVITTEDYPQRTLVIKAVLCTSGRGEKPGGTVEFRNGSELLGTASVEDGNASVRWYNVPTGIHNLTAEYSGDSNYSQITGQLNYEINKREQQPLVITGVPSVLAYGTESFSIKTNGGSGSGAVTYSIVDGSEVISVTGNTIMVLGAGTAVIRADKAGDEVYGDTHVVKVLMIGKGEPVIIDAPYLNIPVYSGTVLSEIILAGGRAGIDGHFEWVEPDSITVKGLNTFLVKFIPDNAKDYNNIDIPITFEVKKRINSNNDIPYMAETPVIKPKLPAVYTVYLSAGVKKGQAVITVTDEMIEKALKQAWAKTTEYSMSNIEVELFINSPGASGYQLTMECKALDKLIAADVKSFRISNLPVMISFDLEALKHIRNVKADATLAVK